MNLVKSNNLRIAVSLVCIPLIMQLRVVLAIDCSLSVEPTTPRPASSVGNGRTDTIPCSAGCPLEHQNIDQHIECLLQWAECVAQKKRQKQRIEVIQTFISDITTYLYLMNLDSWAYGETRKTMSGELEESFNELKNLGIEEQMNKAGAILCLGAASHQGGKEYNNQLAETRAREICGELSKIKTGGNYNIVNFGKHKNSWLDPTSSAIERPLAIVLFLKNISREDTVKLLEPLLTKLRELWKKDEFSADICDYANVNDGIVNIVRYNPQPVKD